MKDDQFKRDLIRLLTSIEKSQRIIAGVMQRKELRRTAVISDDFTADAIFGDTIGTADTKETSG